MMRMGRRARSEDEDEVQDEDDEVDAYDWQDENPDLGDLGREMQAALRGVVPAPEESIQDPEDADRSVPIP